MKIEVKNLKKDFKKVNILNNINISFEDYEKGKTAIRDGKKIIFFDYHKAIFIY